MLLHDLQLAHFPEVFNFSDLDEALSFWYKTFLAVVDKHAPLRSKRVKHQTLPKWLTQDVIEAMALRDQLKKENKISEYRKQRNKVAYLVKQAK